MAKLKNILREVFEESPQVDKYKVVEGVKNFGIVGKQLYNNNNISSQDEGFLSDKSKSNEDSTFPTFKDRLNQIDMK